MVVIVAVPPSIEREMGIDSNNLPNDYIRFHWREEREMGHIMKLYEKSDLVQCMYGPAYNRNVHRDQENGGSLIEQGQR